ncbi:MAG TPA: hypothetical protein VMD76_12250, partial [Candidatus Sulfotelmatobacter sp.]|nr:hypothetical protein [Candidatus Sulfotelmatobacter sp.]
MPLGLYISVPFCKTKCSYCNFASDVFSRAAFDRYVDRLCQDIALGGRKVHVGTAALGCPVEQSSTVFSSASSAPAISLRVETEVDSIYLGGGTPTTLAPAQLRRIFDTVR